MKYFFIVLASISVALLAAYFFYMQRPLGEDSVRVDQELMTQDDAVTLFESEISDRTSTTTEVRDVCIEGVFLEEYNLCGEVIGKSVEGRDIQSIHVGSGDKTLLLIGGVHTGTEKNSVAVVEELLAMLKALDSENNLNVTIRAVVALNQDGLANDMHNNVRGVDLNRNWPTDNWRADTFHPVYGTQDGAGGEAPLSEPETKALYEYIQTLGPDLVITYHSQAGSVEDNGIGVSHETALLYAQEAGYTHIDEWTYYEVTGDLLASLQEIGIPAFDVELETRDVEYERNVHALKAVLEHLAK